MTLAFEPRVRPHFFYASLRGAVMRRSPPTHALVGALARGRGAGVGLRVCALRCDGRAVACQPLACHRLRGGPAGHAPARLPGSWERGRCGRRPAGARIASAVPSRLRPLSVCATRTPLRRTGRRWRGSRLLARSPAPLTFAREGTRGLGFRAWRMRCALRPDGPVRALCARCRLELSPRPSGGLEVGPQRLAAEAELRDYMASATRRNAHGCARADWRVLPQDRTEWCQVSASFAHQRSALRATFGVVRLESDA